MNRKQTIKKSRKKQPYFASKKDTLHKRYTSNYTEEEYAVLKELAKDEETSVSELIRRAVYDNYRQYFKRRIIGFDK